MTCVLGSTWAPFNSSFSWSSMNPDSDSMNPGLERAQSHGYASSGSEARKSGLSSSSKKRASRAGTRSVSTLSAAQLERKRANDREAQRAIRQRTKDHIDGLEKSITDLRQSQDANEKLVLATRQRNRELEEENSYLRLRLNEAGITIEAAPSHQQRPQEPTILPAHASSPAAQASGIGIQRPASTSTSRSFSNAGPQPAAWQQQHRPSYGGLPSLPVAVPGAAAQPGLSTWRSHESTHSMSSVPPEIQTPTQNQPAMQYTTPTHPDRPQWGATNQQYQYGVAEQQSAQYQAPAQVPHQQQQQQPSQQPQYPHPPMQTYQAGNPNQQPSYHPPQLPPQSEFQNLSVSAPSSYQVAPGSQSFVAPPQYQMTPMQTTEYQQPHAQMQASGMAASQYQQPPPEQSYPPQQQAPMQYRDESGRGYSLSHYPSG